MHRRIRWAHAAVAGALAVATACRSNAGAPAAGDRAVNPDEATVPHADHNARHGGVVLMHGDVHYEVVLHPSGRYQVYFSDAQRAPLPATFVSTVTITITRGSTPAEVVALRIADDGESWIGDGAPVEQPDVTARITYEIDGKRYWIDLPFDIPTARQTP